MPDIISGLILIIISIIFYINTFGLPNPRWEPFGSGSYPRIIFGALIILTSILVVQKIWRKLKMREKE